MSASAEPVRSSPRGSSSQEKLTHTETTQASPPNKQEMQGRGLAKPSMVRTSGQAPAQPGGECIGRQHQYQEGGKDGRRLAADLDRGPHQPG